MKNYTLRDPMSKAVAQDDKFSFKKKTVSTAEVSKSPKIPFLNRPPPPSPRNGYNKTNFTNNSIPGVRVVLASACVHARVGSYFPRLCSSCITGRRLAYDKRRHVRRDARRVNRIVGVAALAVTTVPHAIQRYIYSQNIVICTVWRRVATLYYRYIQFTSSNVHDVATHRHAQATVRLPFSLSSMVLFTTRYGDASAREPAGRKPRASGGTGACNSVDREFHFDNEMTQL
ncbi:hypothetical protein EVAR_5814_1 [Eumeta japonica]|uniref:Uncharacterized protein n=1 Tax=Eumeta variegata TaxID=151549 RepID=A0A4C1T763_EUMVA|nr:hypothetical protein EVAR_5814_1 [Eumeta japonica]